MAKNSKAEILSEEEYLISEEEMLEAQARQEAMFQALSAHLAKELTKAIEDKTPVENRMLADEAQYWAASSAYDKDELATGKDQTTGWNTSSPRDNKTRSKTRIASSRIGDMLFPTNAPNWDLRPSPYPDIPVNEVEEEYQREQAAAQAAQPPNPPEGAQGGPAPSPPPPAPNYEMLALKVADRKCRNMRQLIRDALSENDYSKHGRAAIHDGCKLGTGIIKGPYVRHQIVRRYKEMEDDEGKVTVLDVKRKIIPGVARCSPWMFFPLRAANMASCPGAFELHILSSMQLAQKVSSAGFYPKQTAHVLKRHPSLGQIESVLSRRAAITNQTMGRYENSYAVWEYHGMLDAELLRTMGYDIPESDEDLDQLDNYLGTVWFCDDQILRVDMAPLEATDRLPYNVWNYEEDETHIFGFSVPFIMRDDQHVIDMIWTAILHNTSVSAGPQLAIEQGCIIPADKSYDIRSPKLWYKTDPDVSITDAMEAFLIPNTLESTMPVYQQAIRNADDNTMLPHMLGNGQATGQTQGASGQVHVTMMNQTNIVQRQAAHNWDDNVTDPLITGLYRWYMESPDPEHQSAKGDYEVEVRGASHLLVKDTQAQHVQLLMQMAASDPELRQELRMNSVYRLYLNFLDVPIDTLVKTPEEVAAAQMSAQPDPLQQAEIALKQAQAQATQAKAEADRARVEVDRIRAEVALAEAQNGQSLDVLDHSEVMALELRYAEMRDKQNDRDLQLQLKLIDRETKLIEIASKEGLAYEQLNAQVSGEREKLLADLQVTQSQRASEDYFNAARLRLDQYKEELRTKNMSRGYDSFG